MSSPVLQPEPHRRHVLCECRECGSYHPEGWNGACDDDANRYANAEEYARRNHLNHDEYRKIVVRHVDGWMRT